MPGPSDPTISVLVADDDEAQLVLIETLLRRAEGTHHVVTTVPDGNSALAALREKVFDVALLDLSMPGLDGLEVLEGIAGDPARPQVQSHDRAAIERPGARWLLRCGGDRRNDQEASDGERSVTCRHRYTAIRNGLAFGSNGERS